jgi:hypothetical protein
MGAVTDSEEEKSQEGDWIAAEPPVEVSASGLLLVHGANVESCSSLIELVQLQLLERRGARTLGVHLHVTCLLQIVCDAPEAPALVGDRSAGRA